MVRKVEVAFERLHATDVGTQAARGSFLQAIRMGKWDDVAIMGAAKPNCGGARNSNVGEEYHSRNARHAEHVRDSPQARLRSSCAAVGRHTGPSKCPSREHQHRTDQHHSIDADFTRAVALVVNVFAVASFG